MLYLSGSAKIRHFLQTIVMIAQKFATFATEAEEEASSAEEQLASNKFSHHTEIVIYSVRSEMAARTILGDAYG